MTYSALQFTRMLGIGLIGLVFSTPLAACPTASDMEKGVLFRTKEGNMELHQRTGTDRVRIRVPFPDGEVGQLDYFYGLYLISDTPIENGKLNRDKAETFGSEANLRRWPAPVPSARWRNSTPDGGTARSGPLRKKRVGNCTFEAFKVTLIFTEEGYEEVYLYLPELGTGLLIESDDGETRERYRYTAVGILP